jgi:hypothetical protein
MPKYFHTPVISPVSRKAPLAVIATKYAVVMLYPPVVPFPAARVAQTGGGGKADAFLSNPLWKMRSGAVILP